MAQVSNLLRRGAAYSARIRVPLDLVPVIGKRELVRALGTNDPTEAKRRLYPQLLAWQSEFDDLRSRQNLTPADKAHAVWDHYNATLARDDVERAALPTQGQVVAAMANLVARVNGGEIKETDPLGLLEASLDMMVLRETPRLRAEIRQRHLTALKLQIASGETALIGHEVDSYLDANRLIAERGSAEWRDLTIGMARAHIEASKRMIERDKGDYTGQPLDPVVRPPNGIPRVTAKPGESIAEVLDVFVKENPRSVSKSRIGEICRDIGIFMQTIGTNFPIAEISKKHVREWKGLLVKYPIRATEVIDFRGMSIEQTVKANEKIRRPILSDRTVNRYLSSLSALSVWAVSNGYMENNPVIGMTLPKERQSKTFPFTSDQLNSLFRSPLFTGAQSDTAWRMISRPGNVLIRDHRFWVPLIMLFSGMRPGEIGQLAVNDVRQEHGHWIMHITTEGDTHAEGKSVKTKGSMRVVPLHPDLIRLGFLKYHAERLATGEKQLFPGAKRNERGQMMSEFSREFGKYLVRIKMKTGRGLSLYSFRHGATDALRRAGFLDDQFGFILGHTGASMTGRYGIMPQGMLEQRVALINAISYPGLDIQHLVM